MTVEQLNKKPFPRLVQMHWKDSEPEEVLLLHSFEDEYDGTLIYQKSRRQVRKVNPELIEEIT